MGRRPQLVACVQAQKRRPARPARLHGLDDAQGARCLVQERPPAADPRRDGHAEDEEGLGGCHRPGQAAAHERFWCARHPYLQPLPFANHAQACT
jgi:hypothetical protein